MEAQHRRPLMGYLLVALVCGLLIGQPGVVGTVLDTVGGDLQPTDIGERGRDGSGVDPSGVPPSTQPEDPTGFATMIVGEAIRIEPEETGGPDGQGGLPETLPNGPKQPQPSAAPSPPGTPATGAANPGQGVPSTVSPGPRKPGGPKSPPAPETGAPKPTQGSRPSLPDLLPGSATPTNQPDQKPGTP